MKQGEYLDEEKDFSIILGGPFFQLLKRARLTGNALELVKLRIVVLSMFAWLPLLILSMLKGQAWGRNLTLPFINDIDNHVRFLLAMPLLIVAELVVHKRIMMIVKQFRERTLIPEHGNELFHQALNGAVRLRNSLWAEGLMVVLIYGIGFRFIWSESAALDTITWYSDQNGLTLAGIWFRYLSLPVFQFLFIRWYYRLFIWSRFLFQVSRIKLNLSPTHPDDVGGLGFLSNSVDAFMPLALAHGALVAGMISNRIFYQGEKLMDFKIEILIIVVLVLIIVNLSLFSFSGQLSELKRNGIVDYGKLASRFVQEFEAKWMRADAPEDRLQMGGDVQSLSDLSNSYNVVEGMRTVPITRNSIIMLTLLTVAPVLPLLLTMMPIGELVKMLAGLLL